MTEIIKHLNKKFEYKKTQEILEYFLKKHIPKYLEFSKKKAGWKSGAIY